MNKRWLKTEWKRAVILLPAIWKRAALLVLILGLAAGMEIGRASCRERV